MSARDNDLTPPRGPQGLARPVLPRAVPASELSAGRLLAAMLPRLEAGKRLYCVDGGNLFNPYQLTAAARARGLDPADVLERILVSRAYTCHQFVAAVEELLAEAARRDQEAAGAILGIDLLFMNDDIAIEERTHLYGRILDEAARISESGMPLLITFVGAGDSPWVKRLGFEDRPVRAIAKNYSQSRQIRIAEGY